MKFPTDIWNTIKGFLWPTDHNVMLWPDQHPLLCHPESRVCLKNVFLAQRVRLNNPGIRLKEQIQCHSKTCYKIKEDYGIPYCNKCTPKHISITVTYKISAGKKELVDMKKVPKYENINVFNIKHLVGFNVPFKKRVKRCKTITHYYLPNIQN